MGKCKQTRKHRYTFTILISSWQCKYSMTRLQIYHLENSAKNTDIPMSGPAVKNHVWPKKGRNIFIQRKTSCLLLFLDCQSLVLVRPLHRHRRLVKYISKSSRRAKWRRSASKPTRSLPKSKTKIQKKDNKEAVGTRLQDLPKWLEELTENLEDQEVPASKGHIRKTFLRTQIQNILWKWHPGSTVFLFTSPETSEIAKSERETRLRGLLAEDALAKRYLEQKSLVTC